MLYVIISTVFFVKILFAMHIYTYREEHPMNDSGIMITKKSAQKIVHTGKSEGRGL